MLIAIAVVVVVVVGVLLLLISAVEFNCVVNYTVGK